MTFNINNRDPRLLLWKKSLACLYALPLGFWFSLLFVNSSNAAHTFKQNRQSKCKCLVSQIAAGVYENSSLSVSIFKINKRTEKRNKQFLFYFLSFRFVSNSIKKRKTNNCLYEANGFRFFDEAFPRRYAYCYLHAIFHIQVKAKVLPERRLNVDESFK